jgi:hypothetical protein
MDKTTKIKTVKDLEQSFKTEACERRTGLEKIIFYSQNKKKTKTLEETYNKDGYLSYYRSFTETGGIDREVILVTMGKENEYAAYAVTIFDAAKISRPDTFFVTTLASRGISNANYRAEYATLFENIQKNYIKKDSMNRQFSANKDYKTIAVAKSEFSVFDQKISKPGDAALNTAFYYKKDSMALCSFNKTKNAYEVNSIREKHTPEAPHKFVCYYSQYKELIMKQPDGSFYYETRSFDDDDIKHPATITTVLTGAFYRIETVKEQKGPVLITEYNYFN